MNPLDLLVNPPRLFAIYGTSKFDPDEPFVGWGLEFPDEAVLWINGAHWVSQSANSLLRTRSLIADAHLAYP
ncbi:hypothetical protein JOF41_006920 [Saccharothrix coeruleofusca]|uniref:hypothetical protein n=1 Tax=Saccharothrix coeruleofusca TaxID=33919 RepID=UPI001AE1B1EC|nr:hypothetical protein [Saccharothrix coeruleofusca]MBP2340742.1 hypothetical protein [Saccharothrix coeruleofusca]